MDAGNWIRLLNEYAIATIAVAEAGAIVYLFKALMAAHASELETAMKVAPVAKSSPNVYRLLNACSRGRVRTDYVCESCRRKEAHPKTGPRPYL